MVKDSLKKLLSRFPFFLDKSQGSNFYKSESVFNKSFSEIYNSLFEVYLQGKIKKHILIWKTQEAPYEYSINFSVSLPDLKKIKILKNNEEIYTITYQNDDKIDSFFYIHESSSENIIPTDKFKIIVETYNEIILCKGFPENDTAKGDIYDHDASLDQFGQFINLARKNFINSDDYDSTEPHYNASLTEDDYHYMNRILFYLEHLQDTPLEVLEIWKLLGIPPSKIKLSNREKILCKMFEEKRRTVDGVYDETWIPRDGEHKDMMCGGSKKEPLLFVNVNDLTPLQMQNFRFSFLILDEFAKPLDDTFFIVPFLNNQIVLDESEEPVILSSNQTWALNTSFINHSSAKFVFKCFTHLSDAENEKNKNNGVFTINEHDVVSDEILISTRGCNSADWYVNPDGSDDNDGMSMETPFQTLSKAISMVESSRNIITLSEGVHELESNILIPESVKIIACPNGNATITNNASEKCFKIAKEKTVYLQNVYLNYNLHTVFIEDMTFLNNNIDDSYLNVSVDVIELISAQNANVLFEDNGEDMDDKIVIDTTNGSGRWDIVISPELYDSEGIVVQEDSDNPNTIIKDNED